MGHAKKEQVTVSPTNACNMQCSYCAADSLQHQETPQTIDISFAKRGIADYFADGSKHQVRFYSGGEPTQAIDIIKECWDYAYSLVDKHLLTEIQTNCYFDQETTQWLAEHITIIWASIDAWPEIQNKYRPVSNDPYPARKVMENAIAMHEQTFVGIRATVVPETVSRQIELLEYFKKNGFDYICTEPVFLPVRQDHPDTPGPITQVDVKTYIYNFVDAWFAAEKMGMTYINSFMVNFDESVEYACRSCLPTPHLTTDGYVSACDLGYYGSTPLKDLIYGKYLPDLDKIEYWSESIKKLRSRRCANMPTCKNCSVKDSCGGGCLGRAYHQTRDFYGVIPEYCWATRYLAKELPFDRIKIPYLHP